MLNPNMEMLKDDVLFFKWQVSGFKMLRFCCLFVGISIAPTVQVYAAGKWLIYGDRPFYPILLMVKAPIDIQNNHMFPENIVASAGFPNHQQ